MDPLSPDPAYPNIWTPDRPSANAAETPNSALPPEEILNSAVSKLRLAFSHHYQSSSASSEEPTFGLYCPIQGADYVIDETLRELARRTGAEVLVVDAAHLLAGNAGRFARVAGSLQLKETRNPLHVGPRVTPNDRNDITHDYTRSHLCRDKSSCTCIQCLPQNRTYFENIFRIASPTSSDQDRPRIIYVRNVSLITPVSRVWYSHMLAAVQNYRSSSDPSIDQSGPPVIRRPSSNMGTPVQRRSHSPVSCTASPVRRTAEASIQTEDLTPEALRPALRPSLDTDNLTVQESAFSCDSGDAPAVNAGRSSPLQPPSSLPLDTDEHKSIVRSCSPEPQSLTVKANLEPISKTSSFTTHPSIATIKGPSQVQTCPFSARAFSRSPSPVPSSESDSVIKPVVVVFGITAPALDATDDYDINQSIEQMIGLEDLFSTLDPPFRARPSNRAVDGRTEEERLQDRLRKWGKGDPALPPDLPKCFRDVPLFRMVTLVPRKREEESEKKYRMLRNVDINELVMRMGISGAGAVLELPPHMRLPLQRRSDISDTILAHPAGKQMYEQWEAKRQPWSTIHRVAETTVERVFLPSVSDDLRTPSKSNSEPIRVSWTVVVDAWTDVVEGLTDFRPSWVKDLAGPEKDGDDNDESKNESDNMSLLDKLREDPSLNKHEEKVLGCVVDRASMMTTFDQVCLPAHTIDAVRTMVSLPLLYPEAFSRGILKEHSMSGCLLFGPPGTGKTMIAKALAKEVQCNMLSLTPSDVFDMWMGESEKLVRATFSIACRLSPCIIFIDEIDALFSARTSSTNGADRATRAVLTQFMQEMDGINTLRKYNIVVVGATNRPFDLDDAVLRRLPRRLLVDLPGEEERKRILEILLQGEELAPSVDLTFLAKQTGKYSGSDLKHLCLSAVLIAVKETVNVPCSSPKSPAISDSNTFSTRILQPQHFTEALREVSPSPETLNSLTALRKWNQEFGEGKKEKKPSGPMSTANASGAWPYTRSYMS